MMSEQHQRIAVFERQQAAAAARIETRLAALLADPTYSTPPRLAAAMVHATLGGGKRFRAFLVLETGRVLGAPPAAALDVAAALECMHAYSLVHDDLPAMDNDEIRRGRPTVWKAFDEWTAVLAGDALLTQSFEIIAAIDGLGPAIKVSLVARLAAAAGRAGMVGGQVIDLEADKLGKPDVVTVAYIDRMQAMKTGALIAFACEAGAILAEAGARERGALDRYSEGLGLAFQISDDLLDSEGDAAVVGKAVGKDAIRGKATHVSLAGVEGARRRLQRVVGEAVAALDGLGAEADALRGAAEVMLHRRA
jgi:farnesyl diphosphate synthase